MNPIALMLLNVAAARIGLDPGQAQLLVTAAGALLEEMAKLDPAEALAWLARQPVPQTGDPKDDAGGPFDRDPVPFVPLPENDPARGGGG